jgi:hypothetical protein
LAQAAWPIASQHWLSTFLCQLMLLVLVRGHPRASRHAFAAGALLGVLIGVQQQRGVIMAGGVALWLIIDALLESRLAGQSAGPPLWRRILSLAAGGAIVLVPLMVLLIYAAGFEPVWRALVVHPLVNYGGTTHCEWGHVNVMTFAQSTFTFPKTLEYLPAVLIVLVPRVLVGLWRRDAGREPVLLTAFALISMLSIAYFPDFIHIAFIAGAFIVAIAESCEWLLRRAWLPSLVGRIGSVALAAAVLAVVGPQLQRNFVRLHQMYPIPRSTAFGRVDFANTDEAGLYDRVNSLLQDVPSRELYCYPIVSHLYLLAAAHNPTRYGFFLAGYNSPDQVEEVVRTLESKRLPYIVAIPAFTPPDDPVVALLQREYEPIGTGAIDGSIFRRKDIR